MRHHPRQDCTVSVVRVEDDPNDPDRVIVTDRHRSRANVTVRAYYSLYRLAPGAEVLSTRLFGWDG